MKISSTLVQYKGWLGAWMLDGIHWPVSGAGPLIQTLVVPIRATWANSILDPRG